MSHPCSCGYPRKTQWDARMHACTQAYKHSGADRQTAPPYTHTKSQKWEGNFHLLRKKREDNGDENAKKKKIIIFMYKIYKTNLTPLKAEMEPVGVWH